MVEKSSISGIDSVIADRIETHTVHDILPGGLALDRELYGRPDGLVMATGYFGEKFTRQQINNRVTALGGKISEGNGFDFLYKKPGIDFIDGTRPDEEYERIIAESYQDMRSVIGRLASMVLKRKGWQAEDVQFVDFVSTIGKPGLARQLADDLGMVNAQANGFFEACAGSVVAFGRRAKDKASYGAKSVQFTFDPGGMMPFDPRLADLLSGQVFTNGATVSAQRAGINLKHLFGVEEPHQDLRHALSLRTPYDDVFRNTDEGVATIIYKDGGHDEMARIPVPRDKKWIDMRAIATTDFFISNTAPNVVKAFIGFQKLYPGRGIDHVVVHHPTSRVIDGVINKTVKLLSEMGITDIDFLSKLKWSINAGNASSSTFPIALGRNSEDFKPGEVVMCIGMGAGGIFDTELFEVGLDDDAIAA
jgi:hypothetical protein